MKIRTKIQLFTSLFMIILILITNASIYLLFYKISVESELDELVTQTNTIIASLNNNSAIAADELLKAFLPTDGMIRIIPEEGDSLVHSRDQDYFTLPSDFVTAETRDIISHDGSTFAVVTKPIIWGNGEIVNIQVTRHLLTLTENMQTLLFVLILASAIIFIPTVIAGNMLSRFLLNPIKALINAMKQNTSNPKWKKIDTNHRSNDELYEMEKSYNDMIIKLKENYEKQEIFVSDASHELKTPISIVKSYAEVLKKRGLHNPEIFHESVDTINSEADRMHQLVEQMLSLAKNKEVLHEEAVDLVVICKETTDAFRGAYDRGVQLDCTEKTLFIKGNDEQLRQIMYILIDNALKYSKEDVFIKLWNSSNQAVISVTDTGPGIPEAERDRIFERFYRVDKARSRETGGTGLGLAIAKAIVEAHQGSLSLDSELGEGSTFTVRLPI